MTQCTTHFYFNWGNNIDSTAPLWLPDWSLSCTYAWRIAGYSEQVDSSVTETGWQQTNWIWFTVTRLNFLCVPLYSLYVWNWTLLTVSVVPLPFSLFIIPTLHSSSHSSTHLLPLICLHTTILLSPLCCLCSMQKQVTECLGWWIMKKVWVLNINFKIDGFAKCMSFKNCKIWFIKISK